MGQLSLIKARGSTLIYILIRANSDEEVTMHSPVRRMQQLLGWRPSSPSSSLPPPSASPSRVYPPGKPLILLIPGYLDHEKPMMSRLARRFNKFGFHCDELRDVVYERRLYEMQLQDLVVHLTKRRAELELVPAIILLGHAVGGLHAFDLAVRLEHAGWYKGKIIVLPVATPFRKRGSFLQTMFLQISLLRKGAPSLLQPTHEQDYHLPAGIQLLCIGGKRDDIVNGLRATIDWYPALFVDADHLSLLEDKHVFAVLLRTIRSFLNESTEETTKT